MAPFPHTLTQQRSKNRRAKAIESGDLYNSIYDLCIVEASSQWLLQAELPHVHQDNPKGISALRAILGLARARSDTFPNATSKAGESYFGPWPWMCHPPVPQLFSFGAHVGPSVRGCVTAKWADSARY